MAAFEKVGISVDKYYAYEIEPNAIKISKKNYPDIIRCGDVTKEDFTKYRGEIDLLMGGFPCQSLSKTISKNRKNLNGKSALFWELARAMDEIKPKYFLAENVAGMDKESEYIISERLGVAPILIDSGDFSAQSRERLYWTNIPVDMSKLPKCNLVLGDILEPCVDEKYFYNCGFDFHGLDKTVCATLHINGHDILKRVNSPYAKCQTLTAVCGGNQQKKVFVNGRVRKLTPLEYERLQTLPDNYTAGVCDGARYKAIGNGWTCDVIAFILSFIPDVAIRQ
jgi:DNA (cytosine-5)-methyltransferase 3A